MKAVWIMLGGVTAFAFILWASWVTSELKQIKRNTVETCLLVSVIQQQGGHQPPGDLQCPDFIE
jgi:hypothetical protein